MSVTVATKEHGKFTVERSQDFRNIDGELFLHDEDGAEMAAFAKGEWVFVIILEEEKD